MSDAGLVFDLVRRVVRAVPDTILALPTPREG